MLVRTESRHLLLRLHDPARFTAAIPAARPINYKGSIIWAVPHRTDEVRVLRNLGVDAPPPVASYYDYPAAFYRPMPHQRATVEFLTMHPRAFVLSDMGTAKTMCALWAWDWLRREGLVHKLLIVAPLSTLEPAWGSEIYTNLTERSYAVLHGDAAKRLKLLAEDRDIYIINPDGLGNARLLDTLCKREDIDAVVIDECFPAGVLVQTPNGPQRIETLAVGDLVDSSWGPRPVTHVFKKPAQALVELEFEDGHTLQCTPNHPFATDRGWQPAEKLAGQIVLGTEGLRALRKTVSAEVEAAAVLQSHVPVRSRAKNNALQAMWEALLHRAVEPCGLLLACVRERGHAGAGWGYEAVRRLRGSLLRAACASQTQTSIDVFPHVRDETHVGSTQAGDGGRSKKVRCQTTRAVLVEQGAPHTTGGGKEGTRDAHGATGTVFSGAWREWARAIRGRARGASCAAGGVRVQPGDPDQDAARQRVSDLLQSGLWQSYVDARCGGGRAKPQHAETPSARPQEGSVSGCARVVRVTHLQQGSPVAVWNLEVEGAHDYIAGGRVVHNCAGYRNKGTERWRHMNQLINGKRTRGVPDPSYPQRAWVWGLTGTPTPNAPTDAWGQCRLINPARTTASMTAFRDLTMNRITQFKWAPKPEALAIVRDAMQPSIRFERSLLDLPPTTYLTRDVGLSKEQQAAYTAMMKTMRAQVAAGEITAVNDAVKLGRLLQICAGASYNAEGDPVPLPCEPRIRETIDVIEQAAAKVIVYVPYTAALQHVADELGKHYSVAVVNGATSKNERDSIFSAFQNEDAPHVLVANPGATSHGLTLTAADTIIWFAPVHSNEIWAQANGRITRPGQKRNTRIVCIRGSAAEKRVFTRLRDKGRMQGLLLDMLREEDKMTV